MPELETGDSVLVLMALHLNGNMRPVGTFTELRLAFAAGEVYAEEYEKPAHPEDPPRASGPVVWMRIFDTALNQHGVCNQLHMWTQLRRTWT